MLLIAEARSQSSVSTPIETLPDDTAPANETQVIYTLNQLNVSWARLLCVSQNMKEREGRRTK